MRQRSCLLLSLALATFTATAPAPAEEPPAKLKTQTVTFKLVREDPDIKGLDRPIQLADIPTGPHLKKLDRTIELVQIPAGTIVIKGPDGKDHEHAIKPIWVSKYETRWDEYNVFWQGLEMTYDQWQQFSWSGSQREHRLNTREQRASGQWDRPDNPYQPPDGGFGISGYPASCIGFQAAQRYCTWLSKLTGKKFRLPTEAEWEYACRAGGPPIKLNPKPLSEIAWFADNSDDQPHPVGKKRPNAWGLYDMLGNVGEYVIRDPKDIKGVIAGGTWSDEAGNVQSGSREPYSPKWQAHDPQDPQSTTWFDYDLHRIGFRVVMEE